MKRMIRHIGAAALITLLSTAAPAAITGVTSAPTTERVAVARATSVALTWKVATTTAGSATVSSASGEFRSANGALLGTLKQPIARNASGPGSVTIPEKLLVPADVIERARRDGHDHFFYRRSFTDGVALAGEIRLQIATETSSAFGIARIALGFGDDTPRVAKRGEVLRAGVELSHTGAGLLRAAWEVAGPNPDADKPVWRQLAIVARPLSVSETRALASPALPTEAPGLYLLRFRVIEPDTALPLPIVRYVVRQESNEDAK